MFQVPLFLSAWACGFTVTVIIYVIAQPHRPDEARGNPFAQHLSF